MSKKLVLFLSLLVFTFTVITGCGTSSKPTAKPAASTVVPPAETSYPLTLKDDSKTEVSIPAKPVKIISLMPSATETLFALGLESRLVAVTKYDDYPQDIQKKVQYVFDDTLHPNNEQILKLNPDLIIIGPTDDKTIQSLRSLKIPVLQLDPQSLDATYATIEKLGLVTNSPDQAQKVVASMKAKQDAITKKIASVKDVDKVTVWLEVSPDLFTAGKDTFMDELITKAGGINIAADASGWVQYSAEKIIAKNPQVVLTTYGYYQKDPVGLVLSRTGWQNIDAVKNKRVVDVDSNIVNRPGPRIIDGLELIAKALYPDLIK